MSIIRYCETNFLLDTTPVASLCNEWMDSEFFLSYCFIPEEIVFESGTNFYIDLEKLKRRQISTTYEVLNKLKMIMAQAKVVDLYNNEGNGDVLLVATALAKKDEEDLKLFKAEWVIVTCDKGVAKLAESFAIRVMGKDEFYKILEDKVKQENIQGYRK